MKIKHRLIFIAMLFCIVLKSNLNKTRLFCEAI